MRSAKSKPQATFEASGCTTASTNNNKEMGFGYIFEGADNDEDEDEGHGAPMGESRDAETPPEDGLRLRSNRLRELAAIKLIAQSPPSYKQRISDATGSTPPWQTRRAGPPPSVAGVQDPLHLSVANNVIKLIFIQDVSGYWEHVLLNIHAAWSNFKNSDELGYKSAKPALNSNREKVWITLYIVNWLELVAVGEKEVWALVFKKAINWLDGEGMRIQEGFGGFLEE